MKKQFWFCGEVAVVLYGEDKGDHYFLLLADGETAGGKMLNQTSSQMQTGQSECKEF